MTIDPTRLSDTAVLQMPCGTDFDPNRLRSDGVLNTQELKFCEVQNLAINYDPVQIGWVSASCFDDFNWGTRSTRAPRSSRRNSASATSQINALHAQYTMRSWTQADVDTYADLLGNPSLWTFMPDAMEAPLTKEAASALIDLSNNSNHHQVYAVSRSAEIIGQVRLQFDVDAADANVAEISYWLGEALWGKGYGSEIVNLFTQRAFADNADITALIARVHRDNASSFAVLSKSGYARIGVDPKNANWRILRLERSTL
jgi:RimJ/RimL family protein N-acetyltransferase